MSRGVGSNDGFARESREDVEAKLLREREREKEGKETEKAD